MLATNIIILSGLALFFLPFYVTFAESNAHNLPERNLVTGYVARELKLGKTPNHLINEKSPYLLQHAFNPVDWFPWGNEAFEKAAIEGKPIFLSIGYSTCHWCHVMAHETFENNEIATYLNKYFICIKVDREERPDLDGIYMTATQVLSGSGGWPMSVFLTPDRKPFYAGTYFPPISRQGLPGFLDLIQSIHQAWKKNRKNIFNAAARITSHIKKASIKTAGAIDENILLNAYKLISNDFDSKYGGFGKAPKFPRPVLFNYILRYYHKSGKKHALEMTTLTLRKMAGGGMYDQVGGGFHRYSVDDQWRVPHFEKMLYDQSQLAISFLETYQLTGDLFFAKIAGETLDYVLHDMRAPGGGFYSAEDADSPLPEDPTKNREGAFYLWTTDEIEAALGKQNAAIVNYYFGVRSGGNALSDQHGEFAGKNILYVAHDLQDTAAKFNKSADETSTIIKKALKKLYMVRNQRPGPHLDDKIITSWNGLMISALAKGQQVLDDQRYIQAAQQAAEFISDSMYDKPTGILFRIYREGNAAGSGLLEDYAFLVQGLLDLYETSFDIRWLQLAENLTKKQIALFADTNNGGFFDNSGKDASVLMRMKSAYDGAEPTGNSVAAMNLLRLARITDNNKWHKLAVKTIETFANDLNQQPTSMPQMLVAYILQEHEPKYIAIAGKPDAPETLNMVRMIHSRFLPDKVLLFIDGGAGQKYLSRKLKFIENLKAINGQATAYLCENHTCKLPITNIDELEKLLTN